MENMNEEEALMLRTLPTNRSMRVVRKQHLGWCFVIEMRWLIDG